MAIQQHGVTSTTLDDVYIALIGGKLTHVKCDMVTGGGGWTVS